ncbi:hypothetical protein [Candidatus Albibeggiatoa sp. nov. NOAA]|uniref:hypothetical protein n=1 Tax=Candidatus Albibeggiatoa sp. nov. NOAA TaxID=3162724 RepID=UPI003304BE74|nr:hypothetical protein [Thiotrichaceae bacterium]
MSDKYTLTVKNDSTQTGSFCIYQEHPDTNVGNITTLAWLAKAAHPTTRLEFAWEIDYDFVWAKTTELRPGTIVRTSQAWPANLSTRNQVDFDFTNKAYTFTNQSQGGYEDNLYINQTQRVRTSEAAVGIGMSGKGTFLVESQPNMKIVMTPKPTYWLVFGHFQEGEVLDIETVTKTACKLEFKGTTNMDVVLKSDNTWEIK